MVVLGNLGVVVGPFRAALLLLFPASSGSGFVAGQTYYESIDYLAADVPRKQAQAQSVIAGDWRNNTAS